MINILKDISIEDFSYIFGLFCADANISFVNCKKDKSYRLQYEISKKDEDIINKLLNIIHNSTKLERTRNTNFKKNFSCVSLNNYDQDFLKTIIANGYPLEKKAWNINVPCNTYCEDDFWRGIIDGDGSLGIRKAGLYLSLVTKSENLKNSFIDYVFRNTGIEVTSNKNKRDDVFNITLVSHNAYVIAKKLYNNNRIHIDRKYNKFLEMKQFYEQKIKDTYITGDCHGDLSRFFYYDKKYNFQKNDVVICLGDIGLNYYLNQRDYKNKEKLKNTNLIYFIVQGNHEKYAKNISSYQKIKLPNDEIKNIKGVFYYEPEYPNLLFAINGYTYIINGKKFLVCGGAYSIDKWYRLQNGWSWFEDEQMSTKEKNNVLKRIKQAKNKLSFDYVLSHTCPYKYQPTHLFLSGIDQSTVDNSMEYFLQDVESQINYNHWFFGHFHSTEKCWDKGMMLYEDLKPLEEI